MRRDKCFLVIFLALVFLALPLFSTHAAQQKGIKLTYSTFFPCTNAQAQLSDAWAKEIQKCTNGKVKISYYSGWPTLKGNEIYEGVRIGAMDIGMSTFAYNRMLFPTIEAIDLPLGYPSAKVATSVINDFYRKYQPKELADVKVLYLHAHGPGLLHSRKPIYKLEDLKGMRVRSSGFCAKMVRALGAEPLFKPQGYTYAYLQDHYVDATFSPMEVLKGWKQAEVIKSTTECFSVGYTTAFYVVMNKKKWEDLPKDVRTVMTKVSEEWIAKHGAAWDESDSEGRKYTSSLGNGIISLSPEESEKWRSAVRPEIEKFIQEAEGKGVPMKKYVKYLEKQIKKCK